METVYLTAGAQSIDSLKSKLDNFLMENGLCLILAQLDEDGRLDSTKEENLFLAKVKNTVNETGDLISRKVEELCVEPIVQTINLKSKSSKSLL